MKSEEQRKYAEPILISQLKDEQNHFFLASEKFCDNRVEFSRFIYNRFEDCQDKCVVFRLAMYKDKVVILMHLPVSLKEGGSGRCGLCIVLGVAFDKCYFNRNTIDACAKTVLFFKSLKKEYGSIFTSQKECNSFFTKLQYDSKDMLVAIKQIFNMVFSNKNESINKYNWRDSFAKFRYTNKRVIIFSKEKDNLLRFEVFLEEVRLLKTLHRLNVSSIEGLYPYTVSVSFYGDLSTRFPAKSFTVIPKYYGNASIHYWVIKINEPCSTPS